MHSRHRNTLWNTRACRGVCGVGGWVGRQAGTSAAALNAAQKSVGSFLPGCCLQAPVEEIASAQGPAGTGGGGQDATGSQESKATEMGTSRRPQP